MDTISEDNDNNVVEWSHNSPAYKEKINSAGWKKKAQEALAHYGKFCHACNSRKNIDVHHLLYGKKFGGEEKLEDLIPLCRTCHEEVHLIYKKEPYHAKNHTIRIVTAEFIAKRNLELEINREAKNNLIKPVKNKVQKTDYNKTHIKEYIKTLSLSQENKRDATILADIYSTKLKQGKLNTTGSEMQNVLKDIWYWESDDTFTISFKAELEILSKINGKNNKQTYKPKKKKNKKKVVHSKNTNNPQKVNKKVSNIRVQEIKAYIDSKKLNPSASKLAKEISSSYDKITNTAKKPVKTIKTQKYLNNLLAGVWNWSSLGEDEPKLSNHAHDWIRKYRRGK